MNKTIFRTRLFLTLCVLCALCLGVQSAFAAAAVATGRCTNVENQGIEYFVSYTVSAANSDKWRSDLTVHVGTSAGLDDAGSVIAMELEMSGSSTRYQCTEVLAGEFSCNSLPNGALITGVYFRYIPSVSVDTDIVFMVEKTAGEKLLSAPGTVKLPPYPCSVNSLEKDFLASNSNYALNTGETLIYNTSTECPGEHTTLYFAEQSDKFAIVNIIMGDALSSSRVWMDVTPKVDYSYALDLVFEDVDKNRKVVTYTYDASDPNNPVVDATDLDGITLSEMPLTLIGGELYAVSTTKTDLWGNPDYPSSTAFDINFYYRNDQGTQGYENSIFHFNRDLNIQFAPYCTSDNTSGGTSSGTAASIYDHCQSSRQLFTVGLTDSNGSGIYVPKDESECSAASYCTATYNVYVESDYVPASTTNYYFATRKCADSSCASMTTTSAYPYSLTVADGDSLSRTYKNSGVSGSTLTTFKMKAYDRTSATASADRPFMITGARMMVDEPGTYVVYGFVSRTAAEQGDLSDYAVKFYVTINDSDSLTTCSTLASNGYFTAYWNDCLDYRLTQLLTFEKTPNSQEATIVNRSAHGVHFTYNSEYSYLPQNLEIASLKCTFKAVADGASTSSGYCSPEDIYVPAYTSVTITGGTAYLEASPTSDEYRIAYLREDTMNLTHLYFTIPVKTCDNVKKIPDTGISLRSPLKDRPQAMRESIPEATNYVFTGNSIEIPAIGLGIETPIPIVHVYYQDGNGEKGWDLSTLGNYVGELEGGSYLPYAGNSALTGHYYSQGVFKNLEHLNIGDEIIIYANDGIKYTYSVTQKFITQPDDVYEMFQQTGERSLTLVTCDNYNLVTDEYERRQLVRATIKSSEPYEMD